MISIINGKRYNTETATEVASYSQGYASDFGHFQETLYKTTKGAWFMYGEGGAMSRYSESYGQGERGPGSRVVVMTPDEVRSWLESHDEVDNLEEYFGDSLEDA